MLQISEIDCIPSTEGGKDLDRHKDEQGYTLPLETRRGREHVQTRENMRNISNLFHHIHLLYNEHLIPLLLPTTSISGGKDQTSNKRTTLHYFTTQPTKTQQHTHHAVSLKVSLSLENQIRNPAAMN